MKIGMLFPGYGSQFVGMGKDLYDNSRIVQEYFEEASQCLDVNFVKLCFASSDIELSKINNAYTALFLVGTATAAAVKEAGVPINYVAGYGVGEYGALCTAAGLSFPDGLYLLNKLANFYLDIRENLDIKAIMIDGISARKLNQICKDNSSEDSEAHIAIYENKTEHIVTGNTEAVDAVAHSASSDGKIKKKFEFIEGSHSPIMIDLVEQLKVYLTKVDFKDLEIPLITCTGAKETTDAKKAQDAIMGQIIKPVYWNNVISHFSDLDIIIVPAPSKYLVKELKEYYPNKYIIGIDTLVDIDTLKEYLKSLEPVVEPVIIEEQESKITIEQ